MMAVPSPSVQGLHHPDKLLSILVLSPTKSKCTFHVSSENATAPREFPETSATKSDTATASSQIMNTFTDTKPSGDDVSYAYGSSVDRSDNEASFIAEQDMRPVKAVEQDVVESECVIGSKKEFNDVALKTNGSLHCAHVGTKRRSHSAFGDALQTIFEEISWTNMLNANLKRLDTNIYAITKPQDLNRLLVYHSTQKTPLEGAFPYLHGLTYAKQRMFFSESLEDIDIGSTSYGNHFHLMILKDLSTGLRGGGMPSYLCNTLNYSESLFKCNLFNDYTKLIVKKKKHQTMSNRNFLQQVETMLPISNFLVYGNNKERVAKALLAKSDKNSQTIYVIDPESPATFWKNIRSQFIDSESCKQIIASNDLPNAPSRFLDLEQNLIWMLNKSHTLRFRKLGNINVGTVVDYRREQARRESKYDMIIRCHENAQLPSFEDMYLVSNEEYDDTIVTEFDFPASGSVAYQDWVNPEMLLAVINFLKIIHQFTAQGKQIFIYSFDGLTGVSLLILALSYMLDPTERSLHEVMAQVLSEERLYFFKQDFLVLEHLATFMGQLKKHPEILKKNGLISDFSFALEDVSTVPKRSSSVPLDLASAAAATSPRDPRFDFGLVSNSLEILSEKMTFEDDWFNQDLSDYNFPSRITRNVYLGSYHHANSFCVLNSLKITKLVSMGERPHVLDNVKFDYEDSENGLKPIFECQKSLCKIYEVNFDTQDTDFLVPQLKSVVFVRNMNDDGRDLLAELLTECPEHIQAKFLIDPLGIRQDGIDNERVLVHCRIGVSRSASIVIATIMKYMRLNLVEAYMFVRVRRLNIIIQPNLRFFFDLYLYEEYLGLERRYLWSYLCHEIGELNEHYLR